LATTFSRRFLSDHFLNFFKVNLVASTSLLNSIYFPFGYNRRPNGLFNQNPSSSNYVRPYQYSFALIFNQCFDIALRQIIKIIFLLTLYHSI
jgi:hypothetical protein